MSEEKQQKSSSTFFGGAAILAAGILIVKVISAVYKMPLVNILGAGYTDFTAAFNIFNILLMISTAGIPVAVSKMISEANTQGRPNQIKKIFRIAFLFFFAFGAVCSAVMFLGADGFAALMGDTKAADCMRALAPSVMLVSGLAVYRGYCQGHQHMTPSSISQIIEALFKLIVGLSLAWYLLKVLGQPDHIGAAGAIVGVTVSELVALIYMTAEHFHTRAKSPLVGNDQPDSTRQILKTCLSLAVPITLASSSTSIITAVDNAMVMRRLQNAGLMLSENAARSLMSNYTGVQTVYQIPASLMVAITASVIPAVTICFTRKDRKGAARIVGSSLKTAALIAFPSGVGMVVLGTPIVKLLFPALDSSVAGVILSILGVANIFVCLMLVCNSILQSHGVLNLPIVTMLIGGTIMVLADYFMVGTASINIYGSPVGTCICYGTTCCLDLFIVYRIVPGCPSFVKVFGKTLLASVIMGGAAWAIYGLVHRATGSNTLGVAVSILAAVVIYVVLIIALRVLNKDDLSLMPKGDKIGRLLHIQ
ncbi:MAG: polysaccharide biosynthesis protein [Clostridiales bacterium]|nr:polysaccharide biosynthesis protein [Clostridiales bacterium]